MGISSEEARSLQFSGTAHSYDGSEVEEFRRRVVEALAAYEAEPVPGMPAASGSSDDDSLAEAQRIRHQAVQLAERMLREVMGNSPGTTEGLQVWQDAAMLRATADEQMTFAREEARRVQAMALAEADEMRARYAQERNEVRAELQRELQASRAAAGDEAESIRRQAAAEAAGILSSALVEAEERKKEATAEAERIERRLGLLHTVLADAEARFRRLATTAANEVGTLVALADQDVDQPDADDDVHVASVDLTEQALEQAEADDDATPLGPLPGRNPDVGFYQRRLAGLRDRLEKSGHPPE